MPRSSNMSLSFSFLTNTLYAHLLSPIRAKCPTSSHYSFDDKKCLLRITNYESPQEMDTPLIAFHEMSYHYKRLCREMIRTVSTSSTKLFTES